MKIRDLSAWLATLPPEMDDAEIASAVGPFPAGAKRVIAAKSKDGTFRVLVVNSMGTHLSANWWKENEIVSVLTDP